MQLAPLERRAQDAAGSEQIFLAHDFVERARPHPIGERRARVRCRRGSPLGLAEEVHYVAARPARAASQAGSVARSVKWAIGWMPQRSRSAGLAR